MSMHEATHIWRRSRAFLLRRPLFVLPLAWLTALAVTLPPTWSDGGPLSAAFLMVALGVLPMGLERKPARPPSFLKMIALVLLHVPLALFWPIVSFLIANTNWWQTFSTLWAIPMLFFLLLAWTVFTRSAQFALLQGESVDRSLTKGWMEFTRNWRSRSVVIFGWSLLFLIALAARPIGIYVILPLFGAALATAAEDDQPTS